MEVQSTHPIKVFYCYAHEDDALREQLARHLSPLRRLRDITGWFDRDIQPGVEWKRESEAHLDAANVILVLISADFMASDYRYTVEMTRALERHQAGTAKVIPILLKPVDWEDTPLGRLAPLPTNRVPVTQWADPETALLNVVQGIKEIVRSLLPKQDLSPQDAEFLYQEQGTLSGQTVGEKYVLGELLGEGGFGAVYKAQHLHLQRPQAVKILLERYFQKSAFRERFLREAQTVAVLDHPNIIHLDDFGVEPARAYLVMPFLQGGTLQDILQKQQQPLELGQVGTYLEHICAALDYAHARGVVHLDLKPLNLLVRDDGGLLLADFGLAHLMKQGAIEGGASLLIGSPHYMAPEHIQGKPEQRSDLFSLGVILYQMLVGRLPFEGSTPEAVLSQNLTEWPVAPRSIRPELPAGLEDVVGKALAKQAVSRYQTASELFAAFKQALTGPIHPWSSQPAPNNVRKENSAVPKANAQQAIIAPLTKLTINPKAIGVLRTLTDPTGGVTSIALSANGLLLASGSGDQTIKLWNVLTGQLLHIFSGHTGSVASVALSADGILLASGSHDGTSKVWNTQSGALIGTLAGHTHYLSSVALSADGLLLATGSLDGTIKLWNTQTGRVLHTITSRRTLTKSFPMKSVTSVALSANGHILASCDADAGEEEEKIFLWNTQSGKILRSLKGSDYPYMLKYLTTSSIRVALSANGQVLVSGNRNRRAGNGFPIWDVRTGNFSHKLCNVMPGSGDASRALIALSADGGMLAAEYGRSIRLYNTQMGKELAKLSYDIEGLTSIALSTNGLILAIGAKTNEKGKIEIWGVKD